MARAGSRWACLLGVAAILAAARPTAAQRVITKNAPRPAESVPVLTGVFPPGVTIGTTTEWTLSGRNLASVERILISGTGVETAEITSKSGGSLVVAVRAASDAEPGFREIRAESPDGFSNLLVFRVDHLAQSAESEPNDDPSQANDLPKGSAAVGVLKPQDVDTFRIEGRAGRTITIDVEAQRLGTAILPVVTVLTPRGVALAQGREDRSGAHDCRLSYRFPRDGPYLLQLRDNTYGGSTSACYRLRVEEAPYATGLFPLGGPRGRALTVTASGGNLKEPRSKSLTLPDEPGAIVEVGTIDGPGGPVIAPAKLVVGDGPEVTESPADSEGRSSTPLPLGTTANGRIARPREVDRYLVPVKQGERIRVRVQAATLGSWLDSVLTLRDPKGNVLEENDDPGNPNQRGGGLFGLPETPPDSVVDYEAKEDGTLPVEVTDRYGDGGPEYAYRLSVGPPQPDFSIALLLGNPNANRQLLNVARRAGANVPGASGSFNLKPGSTTPLNFLVTPGGRPGPVTVKVEGLPAGVSADPVTVRIPGATRNGRAGGTLGSPPVGGSLVLRVAPHAEPAVGAVRVVGTAKLEDGTILRRVATASLAIDVSAGAAPNVPGGAQIPIPLRVLTTLPLKIVGVPRPTTPTTPSGPPRSVALVGVRVPGVVLQGGRIELGLELDPPGASPKEFKIETEVHGGGLTVSGLVASESSEAGVALRALAAANAPVGVATVTIRFRPEGKTATVHDVPVIIRAPLRVSARPEPIVLGRDGTASLWVGVEREPGYLGPVELRVAGLPRGVRAPGRFVVPPDENGGIIRLVRTKGAVPQGQAVAVRVFGVARMPQGTVAVDSAIRPMVNGGPAEE